MEKIKGKVNCYIENSDYKAQLGFDVGIIVDSKGFMSVLYRDSEGNWGKECKKSFRDIIPQLQAQISHISENLGIKL